AARLRGPSHRQPRHETSYGDVGAERHVNAIAACLERAAYEAGRFRRRIHADPELSKFENLADRLADEIELALTLLHPSAAELYGAFYADCVNERIAVE